MSNRDLEPRVVALDEEPGDEIVSVLSSDTTRRVYTLVEQRARTPIAIADELELSIQNVHYHLEKIQDVGLVEPTGIEYSEKGREMKVYEPAHDELVICSDTETKDRLDRLLKRLVDGTMAAVVLAALSHLVLTRIMGIGPDRSDSVASSVPDSGAAAPETTTSVPWWEFPSIWILVGILFVTVVYSTWRYHQERPPR